MDFKLPFLHKHYLFLDEYEKQEAFCDECNQQIVGLALTCEHCKFWLHQSCAQRKLPCMISHPLHSQQTLKLKFGLRRFICGKCSTLSGGYGYYKEYDSFKLDVICAFSTNDKILKEESERSKGIANEIRHFCHKHSLTLFNYRKVSKYEICCSWCDKPLSGMSYGCLDEYCSSPIFLHQFCLYTIPYKILDHFFHPSHPLFIDFFEHSNCGACEQYIHEGFVYYCERCNFQLHVLCAKLKPTLRHECHEHSLAYVVTEGAWWISQCQKCNSEGNRKRSTLYRCVQCNCNFHFDCLIPPTVKHEYHRHSLTVMTEFREEYSEEYYCDICEKQRNSDHHVYCCKECMYTAHIECALGKGIDVESSQMLISSLKYEESQQRIKDFKHNHPLIFKEIIGKDEKFHCRACDLEVSDEAYECERKSCRYYLHKTCGELPYELLHPLHSLDHPLILLSGTDLDRHFLDKYTGFICDNCRDTSSGFMYRCLLCNFKLDIKCVVGTASKLVNQLEGTKEIERSSIATATHLSHSCHYHDLFLGNFRATDRTSSRCVVCLLNISGPAYCCRQCNFYIHESCLGKLPQEIQIPSPPHTLHLSPGYHTYYRYYTPPCFVCSAPVMDISYRSSPYSIITHFHCASSLKHPLCLRSHPHNLYLFHRNKLKRVRGFQHSSKCRKCNKSLENKSIYHCIECHCYFHLQCVDEISYRFKSKYHIHPLTLKDGLEEDDFGEYYCDICEEKRDLEDDVYYCEECDEFFVAHIKCAVAEVEGVLQKYGPAPYSPSGTWGDDVVVDQ